MEYRKIEGDKRKTFVYVAGDFGYIKNKENNGFVYLKCKHRHLCDGSAKIVLLTNLLETIHGHTCGTRPHNFDHLPALEKMRDMASTTQLPLREIYNNVIQSSNEGVKAALTFRKCEQILQSARRSRYNTNPKSPNEAVLNMLQPNPFSNIYKGFVEFEDQRALFFCSSTLLTYLSGKILLSYNLYQYQNGGTSPKIIVY
jgi:hypothetical protein